ncbi:PREDICTED: ubinuclein-1-like [Calidris pugnax]|uniref:ubinuclein-1-like n=1 Tax=Calidris pugnax TaxID=198806 RepID=UPI00071DE6D4|nr:PREDICTED: ubinuclein-1-like [Calidris pugnax]
MTQPRRVSFTTLRDPQSTSLLKTFGKDQPQSREPPKKTARITISLFAPDDDHYPEFFYPDLLKSCQESGEGSSGAKKTDHAPPFDGDEKEQQEVAALARKFEEKYVRFLSLYCVIL